MTERHLKEVIKTEFTSICACGGVHESLGSVSIFGELCEMYRCQSCLGLFSRPLPQGQSSREEGADAASI